MISVEMGEAFAMREARAAVVYFVAQKTSMPSPTMPTSDSIARECKSFFIKILSLSRLSFFTKIGSRKSAASVKRMKVKFIGSTESPS